ncbi:ATP-dependent helicase HrpB [Vibrio sp. TH_r3]|uniref:ATP-dependent helicase HrpB n=1 Tax=Vibrio sp. TH_r3 TaxID=3082084 RepID=UPI0029553919|nr:ATP-dependent helicase HrpB [Vibrio sp. TH_r3]MDV7104442.1 ATP-dependent helicase HrpB [Vibrio sp. TH_r3]
MSDLLTQINLSNQIILKAPPGAGKSTFFPLELIRNNIIEGKIVMLEPRRLAAKNIAHYLAKQLGEKVGECVGFRVRGETKTSSQTKLEIVTEGVMTRMLQSDPELTGIGLLIFDEFHERSIHADTALAFALEVQDALRDNLKIVLMSATLDNNALHNVLPEAKYIESEGRSYPIDYQYSPLRINEGLISGVVKVIERTLSNEGGSILVFLPSVSAIKSVASSLEQMTDDTLIFPLYGRLTFQQQQQAIAPNTDGKRKVVLATNIAETSLTIEGIRIVIDSGLERVAKFDLKTGITKLEESRITQSSAIQRAGRAGRLQQGLCIRLYSEEQFKLQASSPEPEILRSDLSSLCLELIQWGATEVNQLRWLDVPLATNLSQGFDLLEKLGLITDEKKLTSVGLSTQKLAIEPRLGAMLSKLYLYQFDVKEPNDSRSDDSINKDNLITTALALIAMIEESSYANVDIAQSLYLLKEKRHRTQHSIEARARYLAQKIVFKFTLNNIDDDHAGLCLALAYPDRIAQQRRGRDGQFLFANGHGGAIDSLETLSTQDYIVAVNLIRSNQQTSQIFAAARLNISQLYQVNPSLFEYKESVDWDDIKGQLIAEKQLLLGKLIISVQPLPKPDAKKMTQALLNFVRRKGLSCLNWTTSSLGLLQRIRCGVEWFDEKSWPDFSEQGLLDNLESWLEPFMTGKLTVNNLTRIDLSQALLAYLGWPLNQEINTLLPVHYQLPTGSKKTIIYKQGSEPMISVRMQEVFGERDSPLIADGRKRIVLELLSPAYRPLQITSDLASFWAGSYQEVRKEMKGRYPKHPWPDDPVNHVATTKTKRQLKS